jgi:hypothetical protein
MDLRNFELEETAGAIALKGLGLYWDLHSYAELTDIRYFTVENTVEFRWHSPDVDNPWGDKKNYAKRCILKFVDVSFLRIVQDETASTNEDDCVASISQVTTKQSTEVDALESRMKNKWREGEDFGLLFELQSGRTVEVRARSAELIAL